MQWNGMKDSSFRYGLFRSESPQSLVNRRNRKIRWQHYLSGHLRGIATGHGKE
jgi:hypothetical protein